MKKIYFRWKDENCNGINPEWVEMTGKEFLAFKRNPENKHRKFIQIGDESIDDEILFMESTPEHYKRWKQSNNKAEYCKKLKYKYGIGFVSLDEEIDATEEMTLHDVIADEKVDIEKSVLHSEMLIRVNAALKTLTEEEYELVYAMFLSDKPITERVYAEEKSLSKTAVNNRKQKILKKLRIFIDQN